MKIGIIIGSTREGRAGLNVGKWIESKTTTVDADFEIIDIKEFNLPFFGTEENSDSVKQWNHKLAEMDGFIFITPEYNHSITGALKNALDSARDAWYNKAAGIVSYGSSGGARAAEHLRGILLELRVPSVKTHITVSLFDDFDETRNFQPRDIHNANINILINEVLDWSNALKSLRK